MLIYYMYLYKYMFTYIYIYIIPMQHFENLEVPFWMMIPFEKWWF